MYKPTFRTKSNGVPILSKAEIEVIGENFIRDFCPDALVHPQIIDVDEFVEFYLGLNVDYFRLSSDGRYLGAMVFNTTDKVIIYDEENNRADYVHVNARTVIIDSLLLADNQEHRYRFTMGHEAAHDILHWGYFAHNPNQMSMFDSTGIPPMIKCRETLRSYSNTNNWSDIDWMEWQANYFSAVFQMPSASVKILFDGHKLDYAHSENILKDKLQMISTMSRTYNVSPDTAQYRLKDLGYIENKINLSGISFLGGNFI